VQIIRALDGLRKAVAAFRSAGETVALVPTMGALHAGHMALVAEAKARADRVVVSIFVNPTQFGPNEDLAAYPRQEAADAAVLEAGGADLLWVPGVGTMYPDGFATRVSVEGVSAGLCGGERPGHFDGVATVVAKLFGQVRPDFAVFGEKDFQQLAVVRRMTADLNLAVEVLGVATEREADGLALSSRNAFLTPEQRRQAGALPKALTQAAREIAGAGPAQVAQALAGVRRGLEEAGFRAVDYVELRDADTLAPLAELGTRPGRLLAAARIGSTRLIDNVAVPPPAD
jgi:pantoate--beta-alanine ligase